MVKKDAQLRLEFGEIVDTGEAAAGQRRADVLAWAQRLRDAYLAGHLGGTTHEVYPDVPKGSRENYLYFTLAPALNFQRSSEGLWRSALRTYEDPTTKFVFLPEEAASMSLDDYREALVKHRLALQPKKHSEIWYRISRTLHESFAADPRQLLKDAGHDVSSIKLLVLAEKKKFPYISGPKLLNYWLYMLLCFTDVELSSRHDISIIPDTHVCRATQRLGLLPSEVTPSPDCVATIWRSILADSDISPCDLHAPLWRWSRANFPEV